MKKRTICVIASSRATYGYKKNILKLLQNDKDIDLKVIVTGMHLSKKHGYSVKELLIDKIKIFKKIHTNIKSDSKTNHVKSLSTEIFELSAVLEKIKPDLLLVTGDRAEMFAAAFTAAYMGIPIAHIQAGDLSGHIDGSVRHAITKISHIHFASCKDSALRVKKLGEQSFRIFNTGAPQIDDFYNKKTKDLKYFEKKYKITFNKKIFLILYHPVLFEIVDAEKQIIQILDAVSEFNEYKKIIIYPNIDVGNSKIIKTFKKFNKKKDFQIFKNLNRDDFIFLLKKASILIGNSSCGILEASSFKLPVINIGNRQRGRLQSSNIINAKNSSKEIILAINKALYNKNFLQKLKKCTNPYGNGKSSLKIVKILKKININKKLLDKINTY
jgi:GDP/UDP-N,N'-diacetylbacillosamine 2-epimerase (hydrolysing)